MATSKRDWRRFQPTYRAKEMQTLANWIQAGESGSLIGLAGAGKSNLLGFLCHHPDAMQSYLKERPLKLALVQVDLNNLPGLDLATFYRIILRSLHEAQPQFTYLDETLPPTIEQRYRKVEDKLDPFLGQSALRETLLLLQDKQIRLVLVLDPFDSFCRTAPTQVLDNLRGLRDGFKTTLSYLIGLRHEVTYARDPAELGELYEIVDTHQCWLGPMGPEDARWVISQVEEATAQPFTKAHRGHLVELTGGYPAFLRAASLWLADRLRSTNVSSVPDLTSWEELLLAEPSLNNRLQEVWQGLTGEEEVTLSTLQKALVLQDAPLRRESLRQIEEKYQAVLTRLQAKGLCRPISDGWQIFSPLFAKFVAGVAGISAGKVRYEAATDRFFRGESELNGLSEKDRRLLHHFLESPYAAQTIDDLIEAAWLEDDSSGVTNQSVQQAIRHLRKQIEPNPAKLSYLLTERRRGYRFFPEGKPRR